jgi:hypothetical protein
VDIYGGDAEQRNCNGCRGFDLGRFAPIDTFEHVVWEARYMLLFILFMVRPSLHPYMPQ